MNGLRLSAAVILVAAYVVWKFLPARAHDHDRVADAPVGDPVIAVSAGGG